MEILSPTWKRQSLKWPRYFLVSENYHLFLFCMTECTLSSKWLQVPHWLLSHRGGSPSHYNNLWVGVKKTLRNPKMKTICWQPPLWNYVTQYVCADHQPTLQKHAGCLYALRSLTSACTVFSASEQVLTHHMCRLNKQGSHTVVNVLEKTPDKTKWLTPCMLALVLSLLIMRQRCSLLQRMGDLLIVLSDAYCRD